MKVLAEIFDYDRLVGVALLRPSEDHQDMMVLARISDESHYMLTSIENQVNWTGSLIGPIAPIRGNESIILQKDEVQLVFDALWKAGMRPTHE